MILLQIRVDLGLITIKCFSTYPRSPEPNHQMWFSVTPRNTFFEGGFIHSLTDRAWKGMITSKRNKKGGIIPFSKKNKNKILMKNYGRMKKLKKWMNFHERKITTKTYNHFMKQEKTNKQTKRTEKSIPMIFWPKPLLNKNWICP